MLAQKNTTYTNKKSTFLIKNFNVENSFRILQPFLIQNSFFFRFLHTKKDQSKKNVSNNSFFMTICCLESSTDGATKKGIFGNGVNFPTLLCFLNVEYHKKA